MQETIEKLPGSYVLILESGVSELIQIGKRMTLQMSPGYYCYIGSARGPGGLASRLKHHMGSAARPHWHIDYLRKYAPLIEIWLSYSPQHLECTWAKSLQTIGELYSPIKGFGASDCACSSHLMYSSTRPDVGLFKHIVMQESNGQPDIECITMESVKDGNG